MYPFLASILNMSPHIRTRLGPSTLLCLVPGVYNKGESVNVDCILDIFVDEMLFLDTIGVDVYDAFKQESFICHARLVFFMSDYRGLQKLTRLPGTPAVMPCPRCWLAGYKYNVRGKMLYPSYGCRLPPGHHLRQKAMKLNRGNLRAMDMPARERSDLEVITGARAPMPDQHTPAPGVLDAIRRIGGPFSTKRRLAGEGTNIGDLHQVPGQTMDQTRVQPVWSETDADGMELLGGDAVSDECDSTDNEEECGPADVPNPGAPGKEDLKRMQSYLDRTLSIQDTRILPRRLGYIFDAGMKSKTSDYFALFGPNGTAMFGQLQDMPGRCKDALIAITQAAGDIWAKTPRWSEIDALERRVYEAVTRIEAEWTAAELDVKLHLMTHSVDGIRKLGPAHQHAMFHAESTWGALININHNRKDPAANIMCAVADYTQCLLYKLRTLQDLPPCQLWAGLIKPDKQGFGPGKNSFWKAQIVNDSKHCLTGSVRLN
ncbi:hypothetical protein Vretifemale_14883 [Volvox reticuliferus]|nr:hypothetical protein Vretifemale_14883 [Volvox reticuliferus]